MAHATPAPFAASVSHRRMMNEIAQQYFDNGVDVLLGGGESNFRPKGTPGAHCAADQTKRTDGLEARTPSTPRMRVMRRGGLAVGSRRPAFGASRLARTGQRDQASRLAASDCCADAGGCNRDSPGRAALLARLRGHGARRRRPRRIVRDLRRPLTPASRPHLPPQHHRRQDDRRRLPIRAPSRPTMAARRVRRAPAVTAPGPGAPPGQGKRDCRRPAAATPAAASAPPTAPRRADAARRSGGEWRSRPAPSPACPGSGRRGRARASSGCAPCGRSSRSRTRRPGGDRP